MSNFNKLGEHSAIASADVGAVLPGSRQELPRSVGLVEDQLKAISRENAFTLHRPA